MTTALDDFTVYKLGDLGSRVVLGAVEFEGLTSSGVVVQHTFKGSTNVNGLDKDVSNILQSISRTATYVNWPEALLHVVGGEKVRYASKLVKKVVFKSEHGSGPDDGGLGVDRADHFLSPSLWYNSAFRKIPGYH